MRKERKSRVCNDSYFEKLKISKIMTDWKNAESSLFQDKK